MGRPHTRATLQEKGYHFELGLIRAGQMAKRPPSLKMPTFTLQRSSGMPLHRQVYLAVRELVLTGRLREGERLPSSRALAKTLGISRNTVVNAYARLAEKNLTVSTVGSGTHVASTLPHAPDFGFLQHAVVRCGFDLAAILRRSHYPVQRVNFLDGDGNKLYLYDSHLS